MTIEEIKEAVRNGRSELEDKDFEALMNVCHEVDSNSTRGEWKTIIRKGNDYKYGRVKVNVDDMTWRGLSFDEFYGGGIVD